MTQSDADLQQAAATVKTWMRTAKEIAWKHLEAPTDEHVVSVFLAICQEVSEARDAARGVERAGDHRDDDQLLVIARGELRH